ncbi:TolC family protein [Bacillus piscicola]|uniref:TolC family protein n=1 Tax=Bacillus piscicola TaxID=1632684 RepID=UPI001F08BE35|nr:TolC family protein [Bacillus piscicola]
MKKAMTTSLAVMLAASSFTPAAFADGVQPDAEEEQGEAVHNEEDEADQEEAGEEEELIETLTLEEAVAFALDENTSLLLLNHRLGNLESELGGAEKDYRDLKEDIEDLEDKMDELRDIQKETGNRTFQSRLQIQNQIEALEDQLKPLEDAFRQMNSSETSLTYEKEKAEEGVKLAVASKFMQVIGSQEQLELLQDSFETESKRVANVKKRYEVGVASRNEFYTAQRELTRLQAQIDQLERQIKNDTAVFTLDIGIVNHPDLKLQAPELEDMTAVTQEKTTEELIENSYSMKSAKEALALAKADREATHEDEDATTYEKNQADIAVEIEEKNIVQLKEDLTKAIDNTFKQAADQYQAMLDARFELDFAKEDYNNLRVQLNAGVIAQADYDLASVQVEQKEVAYEQAKQNYILAKQQVESVRNGLIQQQ